MDTTRIWIKQRGIEGVGLGYPWIRGSKLVLPLLLAALGAGSCAAPLTPSASLAAPAAPSAPSAPPPDPCELAVAARASAARDDADGRLFRAQRALQRAAELCPAQRAGALEAEWRIATSLGDRARVGELRGLLQAESAASPALRQALDHEPAMFGDDAPSGPSEGQGETEDGRAAIRAYRAGDWETAYRAAIAVGLAQGGDDGARIEALLVAAKSAEALGRPAVARRMYARAFWWECPKGCTVHSPFEAPEELWLAATIPHGAYEGVCVNSPNDSRPGERDTTLSRDGTILAMIDDEMVTYRMAKDRLLWGRNRLERNNEPDCLNEQNYGCLWEDRVCFSEDVEWQMIASNNPIRLRIGRIGGTLTTVEWYNKANWFRSTTEGSLALMRDGTAYLDVLPPPYSTIQYSSWFKIDGATGAVNELAIDGSRTYRAWFFDDALFVNEAVRAIGDHDDSPALYSYDRRTLKKGPRLVDGDPAVRFPSPNRRRWVLEGEVLDLAGPSLVPVPGMSREESVVGWIDDSHVITTSRIVGLFDGSVEPLEMYPERVTAALQTGPDGGLWVETDSHAVIVDFASAQLRPTERFAPVKPKELSRSDWPVFLGQQRLAFSAPTGESLFWVGSELWRDDSRIHAPSERLGPAPVRMRATEGNAVVYEPASILDWDRARGLLLVDAMVDREVESPQAPALVWLDGDHPKSLRVYLDRALRGGFVIDDEGYYDFIGQPSPGLHAAASCGNEHPIEMCADRYEVKGLLVKFAARDFSYRDLWGTQ